MNSVSKSAAWIFLGLSAAARIEAGELDFTGFAELNSRTFANDRQLPALQSESRGSIAVQTELYWAGSQGHLQFSGVAFGRHDRADGERSHLDLRKANFGVTGKGWDVNAGVNKVFWGVTEARHLVDVINQSDWIEDPDEEDKLGQPMVNVNLNRDFGRFELYLLPRFRERTLPGIDSRLGPPLPVDSDNAIFEARDGERHRDVSLRYSHYFGNFDVGAYVFDGTSREPRLEISGDGDRLLPVYEQMQQFGLDVQLTRDAWLWKLEAISRDTVSDSFTAAVTGVEYTFFGVGDGGADVGVLAEYLYDGRDPSAPPTAFDNDVFVGTRLALNDVSDTSLLAGAIVDIETHELFVNVEASRRFGEKLTLDARLRLFGNARPGEASYWLENDDYLELGLSWFY